MTLTCICDEISAWEELKWVKFRWVELSCARL